LTGHARSRLTLVAAILAVSCGGMAAAGQQAPSPPSARLSGRAAIEALIGNTMTGMAGGSPYFAFYDKDGTVKMQRGSDISAGKWAIDGDDLCEEFPEDEDETCYRLELDGNRGTMTDGDGATFAIEIVKDNPRKL
jgi:hypothetical protein